MEIHFRDEQLKRTCENFKELRRKYGQPMAEKVVLRINQLKAAENLYDISRLPQGRLHSLKDDLAGYYAVDLKHPFRLIFQPLNGDQKNPKSITSIKIIAIKDYH